LHFAVNIVKALTQLLCAFKYSVPLVRNFMDTMLFAVLFMIQMLLLLFVMHYNYYKVHNTAELCCLPFPILGICFLLVAMLILNCNFFVALAEFTMLHY